MKLNENYMKIYEKHEKYMNFFEMQNP